MYRCITKLHLPAAAHMHDVPARRNLHASSFFTPDMVDHSFEDNVTDISRIIHEKQITTQSCLLNTERLLVFNVDCVHVDVRYALVVGPGVCLRLPSGNSVDTQYSVFNLNSSDSGLHHTISLMYVGARHIEFGITSYIVT